MVRQILAFGIIICLILSFTALLSAAEVIEPEMVEIPAGAFLYGSTGTEREIYYAPPTEPKQQSITVERFFLGKYEVTNREYAAFIEDGGYEHPEYWSSAGWEFRLQLQWKYPRRWRDKDFNHPDKQLYPVCAVSWYEAEAYCRRLAMKTNKPYRLPREVEWEKAARGTQGWIFPWGNHWDPTACNWLDTDESNFANSAVLDGFALTSPVGKFEKGKSPYGCYDMAGNVMEWCEDTWRPESNAAASQENYRVFRGGSFLSGNPRQLRCAWRGGTYPEIGHVFWGNQGFRVAMDAPK